MPRDRFDDEESPSLPEVLETVADPDCRALLREMQGPRTASELAEASDVPLSTTYRKIDRLADATLIDEVIEIRDDGRHTARYYPNFARIEIALTEELNVTMEIERPARTADERLEDLWSQIRKGV